MTSGVLIVMNGEGETLLDDVVSRLWLLENISVRRYARETPIVH